MSNYRNGYELERAAKQLLEQAGYFVVRAGGSKGAADLVALHGYNDTLLIQCKLDGYVPPGERKALFDLAEELGVQELIASWHKEGRAARRVKFVNCDGEEWKP